MIYSLIADILLIFHLGFIVYVLLGVLLVFKCPRSAFVHLPVCVWGVTVEWTEWLCPLTSLEVYFRRLAGEVGYSGGYVAEYIIPVIYPDGLTHEIQWLLGGVVLLCNFFFYALLLRQFFRRQKIQGFSCG